MNTIMRQSEQGERERKRGRERGLQIILQTLTEYILYFDYIHVMTVTLNNPT